MARITVDDCEKAGSRFDIIMMAAKRAREIRDGSPTAVDADGHKAPVIALKEIAEGYLTEDGLSMPYDDEDSAAE
ncbi:DNA-directed RNA polymerase subunit omega [Candidatus Synchoanobacter obligatus]|uniref:DNA-directed RNA polymerase subunit omega n=1 Tax=Candidatus Synchoanobacter obligatus TaxID=2919597 RepID=A0ABT1L5A3_9GAMM|nr:DNA-directed RNA polymerase subunit omega [Candidatus Synchoanobacter obligatus]MCP8352346.1 DNA-directed RNA polymerase subunit omega [Candidatus Synchoanobacter obligatus]